MEEQDMSSIEKVTPEQVSGGPPADPRAALPQARQRTRSSGQVLEALALPVAWVVLIVVFGVLRPDTFLTSGNASSILASQAVLVVVTLGLIIPLTGGDYDLSVASVVSLSA